MIFLRDYNNPPAAAKGAVLTLGNFDGVHLGHRAVINQARELARDQAAPVGVLTFEPHPRSVFMPESPPFRLTPFRSKFRRLSELGIDLLVSLRFNPDLFHKPAEDFVRDVLCDGLAARHLVVGYDFVFGHKRSGDAKLLCDMAGEHGFKVSIVEPVAQGDDVFSSTLIRLNLEAGRVRRAGDLLGHFWEIEGRVRSGDQRGRLLGFPTANLHLHAQALRPSLGVYAVQVGLEESGGLRWYPGVSNIGTRPTFDGKGVVLEAHLFDFDADIYGRIARVAFVEHLRGERKFDGIEALKTQIAIDSLAAREILAKPENQIK